MKYRYKDYVCPKCWEKITYCKCRSQSWELIMIDEPIQKAIKILNDKGITTRFCCSGHFDNGKYTEIQVKFRNNIDNAPLGWKISNGDNIYFPIKSKSKEEFIQIQTREIQNLIDWAKSKE